jgi:hypothetical protein
MRSLRRFVLAALLTGIVVGCQSKTTPAGQAGKTPEEVARENLDRKLKKAREEPEGPPLKRDR